MVLLGGEDCLAVGADCEVIEVTVIQMEGDEVRWGLSQLADAHVVASDGDGEEVFEPLEAKGGRFED